MENSVIKEKLIEALSSYNEWVDSCKEKKEAFIDAQNAYDVFIGICRENNEGDPDDKELVEKIKKAQRNASVSADIARNTKKKSGALKIQSIMQFKEINELICESGSTFDEILTLLFEDD